MKHWSFLLAALVLLTGCAAKAGIQKDSGYTQIDQETAREMMALDDGHVVVDVRRQDEYDAGHIPGAILIPNETIGTDAPDALPDYDQIILIYCRSGNRSKQAAEKLAAIGYRNVYEFGGIDTWTGEITEDTSVQEAEPAVLTFSSFDGGGYEYSVEIEDPSILSYTAARDYGPNYNELETGSSYDEIFTFTGKKPGVTTVTVHGRSPVMENEDLVYTAVVDENLNIKFSAMRDISTLFLYRNGDIYYNSYQISLCQDGYHVSVNDGEEQYIDRESVDAVMQIIDQYDLVQWDGFDESQDGVLDGEGFWLEIQLTDGTEIQARGDNAFPENYHPAIGGIQEILDHAQITTIGQP